jgi:adenylyltransferase/sulfurtransferase
MPFRSFDDLVTDAKRTVPEVDCEELAELMDPANDAPDLLLIDVREADEWQIAKVAGTTLVPLSQLPQRFTELDPNTQLYLHCKAGKRSMKALEFLRQQGFKYVKSVKGGIDAWSDQIDHGVAKY